MSFHDKRIRGWAPKATRRQLMLRGARKINLWQHLPSPQLGGVDDDWRAVGDDLRTAMAQHALSE